MPRRWSAKRRRGEEVSLLAPVRVIGCAQPIDVADILPRPWLEEGLLMELARIGAGGQTTIPERVRIAANLNIGDTLTFEVEADRLVVRKMPPMTPSLVLPSPFQVSGEHVARFNQQLFPELLRRLLYAEAYASHLPADGIHVASNVTAPDGGEDGRIEWQGGVPRTRHLPGRLNQFQLKAGPIDPAQAAKDVLRRGQVKAMVREALCDRGHYLMLCAHPYARKEIERRRRRILEAVRDAGVHVDDGQIAFWDADQIAAWVNQHPSVAIWVKESTQPGTVGPFRSWTHWASHPDHENSPWVPDERLSQLQTRLRKLAKPRSVLRFVGLSGIGKSRLALEALRHTDGNPAMSDIVMYADESKVASGICRAVETLADMGVRAIVVVNRCEPKTHRALAGEVDRASSRLSLLTIDDEIPATSLDETTIRVSDAPQAVVDAIIGRVAPNLPLDDRRRLVHFSKGFPRIAINVAKAWRSSLPIAHAEDDDLVDAFVLGRDPKDPELVLKSAMLLAVLDRVAVGEDYGQLKEAVSLRHDLSFEDLHTGISRLAERGVVRRKGRLRVLQPLPIAMQLAERQWRDWPKTVWERLLASDGNAHFGSLRTTAAAMLARLNDTPVARDVVDHVCRSCSSAVPVEILPALAEVAPAVVLQTIESTLSRPYDLFDLVGEPRRYVVSTLEQIVFHAESFRQAARLLLRLASAETEIWANNATGVFIGLFRVVGSTEADGDTRLAFLDEVIDTADTAERTIVVEALVESLETMGLRIVGAEVQGSKPALSPWLPPTKDMEVRYVTGCISLLADIAAQESSGWPTPRARSGLAERLRPRIGSDYIDALEQAIRKVASVVGVWPEAIESLGDVLRYDASFQSQEIVSRVEALLEHLRPVDLDGRIDFLVTAMPWNYLAEKDLNLADHAQRQQEALRDLAQDLVREPRTLERALPRLSRGEQRRAFIFGQELGEILYQMRPHVWRRRITQAALDAPDQERNLSLLGGYYVGIARKLPKLTMPLKKRLALSTDLASMFPLMCIHLGVKRPDVELALDALNRGTLRPDALRQWTFGGTLARLSPSEMSPLLDVLLAYREPEAVAVATGLICTYYLTDLDKLDDLCSQIRRCISAFVHDDRWPAETADLYNLEQLVKWMLAKGREDADACATALDLAGLTVRSAFAVGSGLPSSVVRKLLSDFPEVVWPSLGAAIVDDDVLAFAMALVLGSRGFRRDDAPITSLPVEVLFSWCRAHSGAAPAFAARTLPVLIEQGDDKVLHPTMGRLIDEFGEDEDMLAAIESNIRSYTWVGSLIGYYQQYVGPIGALASHRRPTVRGWAERMTRELQACIKQAHDEDAELEVERDI